MRTNANTTVAELRDKVDGTPQSAWLDFILAQDHDARVRAIQKTMDFACNELEQNKQKKQELDEDSITIEICQMLRMAGIQAEHETTIGGHCDIVVRGKALFLWLAEAKKHNAYGWLDKGFQQLSTRYSTGVPGQNSAEILVYCLNKDALAMINEWRKQLLARNEGVTTKESSCGNPLAFYSTHKHGASGLDFNVRHKAVALYWQPQDL